MEVFEEIRGTSAALREAVDFGLERTGKAAGMLRNQAHREALETACADLKEGLVGLEAYVEGRIAHLQRMMARAKFRKERIADKRSTYMESLQDLINKRKALREKLKALPKAKKPISRKPTRKKGPAPALALLSPQELRDQIARKIQRPPAPPQTTGNIWENWSKNPQQTPPPADEENQP